MRAQSFPERVGVIYLELPSNDQALAEQFLAENIARDLREHATDPRHALFIVGYAHAMVNLSRPDGAPMKSAGWHLRQKLDETNVCAVFPHYPTWMHWICRHFLTNPIVKVDLGELARQKDRRPAVP